MNIDLAESTMMIKTLSQQQLVSHKFSVMSQGQGDRGMSTGSVRVLSFLASLSTVISKQQWQVTISTTNSSVLTENALKFNFLLNCITFSHIFATE